MAIIGPVSLGTLLATTKRMEDPMTYLYWTFDWNAKRAQATSDRGTYVIEGDDHQQWTARFHITNDGTDVLTNEGTPSRGKHSMAFSTLSDALRACQRHSEQIASSGSSGRLTKQTPPHGTTKV
jgi:hypothetical protein